MTTLKTLKLSNFDIVNDTKDNVLEWIFKTQAKTVAFANAHCINTAAHNPNYVWALSKASAILPDGSGLQLAARFKSNRFVENLNGTDLFLPLMQKAASQNKSVYLFGSQPGVAEAAAQAAEKSVPDVKIAGTRHGFFKANEETKIIEDINNSGAAVVLVAMGVPKQDIWIARNRHRLNAQLVFGVGAQFDFWSGRVSRSPALLRQTGLEWVWRLAIEPRRMFKRYVLGNPIFVVRALREAWAERLSFGAGSVPRRFSDLIISTSALVALAPLFGLVGLAIKCESKGPVMFKQIRVGQNGKTFLIYKFRSMYADAEARRKELLHTSERKGICFKNRNDPRVTKVGRFLRRFSLDELPQIINVFKGEMAIVGPRPALMQEVAAYPAHALGRLAPKPGITGLWQVSGRAEIGFDRMVRMDKAYAATRTLLADFVMIGLTFRAVLTGRGAF